MTRVREYFSSYNEEMDFQIKMGNKTKCTPVGRGVIDIQMELGASTNVRDVFHVSRLGMNLISVSQLQDKGYDVHFIGKKVFIKHRSWKKVKQIGKYVTLMSTRSLRGYEYFITFIDDHSNKTWIYFLKTKDEVFGHFKEFKALMENVTRKNIKVLCSNYEGEHTNSDFTKFCAKEGIKREWKAS
eukprot:PITA_22608